MSFLFKASSFTSADYRTVRAANPIAAFDKKKLFFEIMDDVTGGWRQRKEKAKEEILQALWSGELVIIHGFFVLLRRPIKEIPWSSLVYIAREYGIDPSVAKSIYRHGRKIRRGGHHSPCTCNIKASYKTKIFDKRESGEGLMREKEINFIVDAIMTTSAAKLQFYRDSDGKIGVFEFSDWNSWSPSRDVFLTVKLHPEEELTRAEVEAWVRRRLGEILPLDGKNF